MTYGISLMEEKGKCDICKKIKLVRVIYDDKSKKSLKICSDCAASINMNVGQAVKKFGKKRRKYKIEKDIQFSFQ